MRRLPRRRASTWIMATQLTRTPRAVLNQRAAGRARNVAKLARWTRGSVWGTGPAHWELVKWYHDGLQNRKRRFDSYTLSWSKPIPDELRQRTQRVHKVDHPFNTRRFGMRLYHAICDVLESYAARLRTETLEAELDAADWALMGSDEDDD